MQVVPNRPQARFAHLQVLLLAGGVGGAKLADGLAQLLLPEKLKIIVNTGDDFQHLGLTICPDLDTVMYTLAGAANVETGWGRAGESWHTIEEVRRLGGPDWFRLGDLDLASHLVRSHILGGGGTLTEATQHLLDHFGVTVNVWPMTDQPAPTVIETDEGLLSFQTWFVGRQWQPSVRKIKLPDDVRATRQVLTALERADLVIIAPSNPFVSIDPILNVYPIREMIMDLPKLVIAVSPIIAGQAVKGPAAKMMREMAMPVSAEAIADYYGPLLDAFIHDERDEQTLQGDKLPILRTDTLMYNKSDRMRFAKELLNFSTELIET